MTTEGRPPDAQPDDNAAYRFPVSVKGVIIRASRVVLLRNEREEWELPGGKLEPGEAPEECVTREIKEELALAVVAQEILDAWVYEITPGTSVLIVTYGCVETSVAEALLSSEHHGLTWLPLEQLGAATMPEGYKDSVRRWAARLVQLRCPDPGMAR